MRVSVCVGVDMFAVVMLPLCGGESEALSAYEFQRRLHKCVQ